MNNLLEKDLRPFFQLQFNAKKEPISAEILTRSTQGNITDIMKILENKNQTEDLDLQAFTWALNFQKSNNLPTASNFSGKSLSKAKVIETIALIDPTMTVKIELTETSHLSDRTVKNINYLANSGFKISLDDFGRDRNGLNRLVELPISEIKVDKFICDRVFCHRGKIAIENSLMLGDRLGCEVVIEGVETEEQFDILVLLGVQRFQGFYLHKPEKVLAP
jgi:EAL domain-containing protein (putative c-di-GMP-specific phosphodiesterase class I)